MAANWKKDPQATLDYAVDWTAWLDQGDTITAAQWTIPDGITQAAPAPSTDGGKATVWLSGGTVGQVYPITCRVTTSAGRVDERTVEILIAQR